MVFIKFHIVEPICHVRPKIKIGSAKAAILIMGINQGVGWVEQSETQQI